MHPFAVRAASFHSTPGNGMQVMISFLAPISAACAGLLALLQSSAQPVALPPFEQIEDLHLYAGRAAYEAARTDSRYRMEKIAYDSDGLEVFAYVYGPSAPAHEARPVVVFNRGSWVRDSFAGELLVQAHRLAEQGFLVVAPMYRGSGGAPGRDEMGGSDLADLFNLLPVIAELRAADSSRIYLYGESRGAMMVYQAIRDDFPALAAAVYGGFTDLDALAGDPQWAPVMPVIWPDFEENRAAITYRRSAVAWPEEIDIPILIMHGGQDEAVPAAHAVRLAAALERHGRPHELIIMPQEGHVLTGRAEERDALAAAWFTAHQP